MLGLYIRRVLHWSLIAVTIRTFTGGTDVRVHVRDVRTAVCAAVSVRPVTTAVLIRWIETVWSKLKVTFSIAVRETVGVGRIGWGGLEGRVG